MFEATLEKASLFKKIIEAMKDLVNEANFDTSKQGLTLQAMDSSHVALVSMNIQDTGFENFRCEKNMALGINLASLSKILKCAGNDDKMTLSAEQDEDRLSIKFESSKRDRESSFDLKLLQIEGDSLGIPETDYKAEITMSSSEFQRICRDLTILGETVTINVEKDEVSFSASGDIGKGDIKIRKGQGVTSSKKKSAKKTKKVKDEEAGEEMNDENEDTNVDISSDIEITMAEPCQLTFALRYLNLFSKATSLTDKVILKLHDESPLVVSYEINDVGYIRYYLAPKIEED
eukprot:TRINITY_DN871_c0_g1_i1.p1 TRINITY_DN871_c0_g1~~TRINITY_DN871_c0_g1_i1.p1  ORF type:complete len:290 (-),score=104.19 TRINITY_DN871_c0_g1_i1:20-889(-)